MLNQFIIILFGHWIADFVCQTHWQASNKSKNWYALTLHVTIYTLTMSLIFAAMYKIIYIQWYIKLNDVILYFMYITFITHFITDAITSRISSRLYAKQDFHNFFVIVGLDQFIHQITLAVTLVYLLKF